MESYPESKEEVGGGGGVTEVQGVGEGGEKRQNKRRRTQKRIRTGARGARKREGGLR